VGFDPEFAAAEGFAVDRIDLAMMALVVAVVGLRAVGLILVVALLIIPPAAARFWTERLSLMAMLAALFGGISGYLGAAASALLPRFPAGVSSSSSPVRSSS
jgi:manganese/zinc/iron transport system permease protein